LRYVPQSEQPEWWPHVCAVTQRGDTDLIDTGTDVEFIPGYERAHTYISASIVSQYAREYCGMRPAEEVKELSDAYEALQAENDALKEENAQLQAVRNIIEKLNTKEEESVGTPV
jgi:DNA-binding transcriptional regulator GbsR (MarR family)